MPARTRDVLVVDVLLVAGFLTVLAWHPLGRWAAFAIAVLGLLAAAGVYRLRAFPPTETFDLAALDDEPLLDEVDRDA